MRTHWERTSASGAGGAVRSRRRKKKEIAVCARAARSRPRRVRTHTPPNPQGENRACERGARRAPRARIPAHTQPSCCGWPSWRSSRTWPWTARPCTRGEGKKRRGQGEAWGRSPTDRHARRSRPPSKTHTHNSRTVRRVYWAATSGIVGYWLSSTLSGLDASWLVLSAVRFFFFFFGEHCGGQLGTKRKGAAACAPSQKGPTTPNRSPGACLGTRCRHPCMQAAQCAGGCGRAGRPQKRAPGRPLHLRRARPRPSTLS